MRKYEKEKEIRARDIATVKAKIRKPRARAERNTTVQIRRYEALNKGESEIKNK